jgi:hypothetical protein
MQSASGSLLKHTNGIRHVLLSKLDVTFYDYANNFVVRSNNSTNIKNHKFCKNESNMQQQKQFLSSVHLGCQRRENVEVRRTEML